MSYDIGWAALNLKPAPRLGHTDYVDHPDLLAAVTGGRPEQFWNAWQVDFRWLTNNGPVPWASRGRVTDMGHSEYAKDGVDWRLAKACPFTDVEQVLAFDAVTEYGLPEARDLALYYESLWQMRRIEMPDMVWPGGYYFTLISGAINSFGWDMLLQAAAYPKDFEKVIDSFFRLSLHHYQAWAKTSIPIFICHDDMVWSEGPFMHPDLYRKMLFPRYRELWAVLKKAGKKVLFCSDGYVLDFLDDLAAAGADGFIFEPMNPLEPIVRKFGQTHVIVGSCLDCRTLTFGTREQIQAEIDATLKLALPCPGFIFAVGNHIPSNVPIANARFYMDYLGQRWFR